jgi:hypothetical protein
MPAPQPRLMSAIQSYRRDAMDDSAFVAAVCPANAGRHRGTGTWIDQQEAAKVDALFMMMSSIHLARFGS